MQEIKVKKLFEEQAQYYSMEDQSAASSPLVDLFLKWASARTFKEPIKICEFGGAAGQLLAKIDEKMPEKTKLFNAEIVRAYQKSLVLKKIKFLNKSILDSHLPDQSFDCLIIRDVLHHLIGKNLSQTRENQEKALTELKRLAKKDGVVLIEELVTSSKISSIILYYLSKLTSILGLKSKLLEISSNTIVSFLTPVELEALVKKVYGHKKIARHFLEPWNTESKARLMHLGAKNWKMFFLIKKT